MKIRDVMNREVCFVTPDTDLVRTAEMMRRIDIGSVPVCDEKKELLGMVTDRDIVVRNVATGKSPEHTMAKDIMTTDVRTGTPNMTVDEACDIMAEWQIRRLPIVEDKSLVGIVSLGDLALESGYDVEISDCLSEICQIKL